MATSQLKNKLSNEKYWEERSLRQQAIGEKSANELYLDSYMRTIYDFQAAVGRSTPFAALNQRMIDTAVRQKWLGDNYSTRLWGHKDALLEQLDTTFKRGVALGENPRVIAREMKKKLASRYDSATSGNLERLARTEFMQIANTASLDGYKQFGVVEKYKILAILDYRTSEICYEMNEEVFAISDAMAGINYPPFHPNCVLPDMIIASPDANAITKSYYSGDVIKVTTANARSFTVTPNHIMLTSRGWVSAKNIIKSDKVIYYRGWDKFTSPFTIGNNPTNNNSVPTIEKLFTALVESGFVSAVTMPASPEYFKSDIAENSEVSIINIDSFLRDKFDSPLCKFISDFPLVQTGEPIESGLLADSSVNFYGICKSPRPSADSFFNFNCSSAFFLNCVGLAADGIMSSANIFDIFFFGSLTHHELISFRRPSDYDSRLSKALDNSFSACDIGFCDCCNTFSRIIPQNNITTIQNGSDGFSDSIDSSEILSITPFSHFDSGDFKPILNKTGADIKDFGELLSCFSTIIQFDSVVNVERFPYIGHVYDASSLSTLYHINGFLSSNCRTTTVAFFEPDEIDKLFDNLEEDSEEMPKLSYEEWRESLEEKHGKAFLQKHKYEAADRKQFEQYKNAIGAKNMPKSLDKFQEMKYNNTEAWESTKDYKNAVTRGDLSPLVSLDDYNKGKKLLDDVLIGMKTSDGVEIKSYSKHFINRYFGSVSQRRSGVELDDIQDALTNPKAQIKTKTDAQGRLSHKHNSDVCEVTINPLTGILVQTNPRR